MQWEGEEEEKEWVGKGWAATKAENKLQKHSVLQKTPTLFYIYFSTFYFSFIFWLSVGVG